MIIKSKWVCGITVIAVSIGLLALLSGCPENGVGPSWTDGTITVGVTGADAHDGEDFLLAVFAEGDDPEVDDPIGVNTVVIDSGMAQGVVLDPENLPTPYTFTGGTTYYVYGLVDLDGSTNLTTGDYISEELGIVVNGDMVVEFVYPDDFEEVTGIPEPEDGTITLRITGADDHNGVGIMGAVGAQGADLNDPANRLAEFVFEIVDGIGEGAAIPVGADPDTIPPPTSVTFTGGESYDVGGWIDADDDGELTPSVDYIFKEGVKTVVVDGDTILELVYPTDFTEVPEMPEPEDGTITVRVTGAGDHNGRGFAFAVYDEGVTDILSANAIAGTHPNTIIGGTVEAVALDAATLTTTVDFTGGMSYVIGGIIDADGNDILSNGDYLTDPLKTVEVDGDMVVEFVYPTDFMEITGLPEPEDGTITVGVTGADAHDGEDFLLAVFAEGDDPEVDDPIGVNTVVIDSGMAQGVALDPENLPTQYTFTGGTTYYVYGLIDLDGSTDLTTGDYVSDELSVEVDGDMVVEFLYPDDFEEE